MKFRDLQEMVTQITTGIKFPSYKLRKEPWLVDILKYRNSPSRQYPGIVPGFVGEIQLPDVWLYLVRTSGPAHLNKVPLKINA